MRVRVEVSGIVRPPQQGREFELDLPEGARAADLVAALGYRADERRALRVCRGEVVLDPGDELRDGDLVVLFAAVGGG